MKARALKIGLARRIPLGPAVVAALVLATLMPAVLVSWLLSSNSSRAIETLAENAMGQAAHRVEVGAMAHLGESHTIVNALVPPVTTEGTEAERTRNWLRNHALFENMAYALTRQSINVPYLYFGTQDGTFLGVEREGDATVLRTIRPGDTGRRHYRIAAPGDRSQLIKVEDRIYDPRQRPWYGLATRTGQRVFTDVYRSAVKKQFDLTLAHPIYAEDQKTLLGVMAVDMSLARLTDLIRSTRVSDNAVTFLVDAQGLMVATSLDEPLDRLEGDRYKRIRPQESTNPLVRAAYEGFVRVADPRVNVRVPGMMRMGGEGDWRSSLGLDSGRLIALQRPFGDRYGLAWQLVVVAPESDFTRQVIQARQWAYAAMAALILVSTLLAIWVAARLSRGFRLLNSSAERLGSGHVPAVQLYTPFREVHHLSQVMHDSAVRLAAYRVEVQEKNEALQDAALSLERRVRERTAELAASREEALAAVKAKAGFLAVMSHEIRTPLHGVVGMSQLLAESALTTQQRDLIGVLRVSSDQLLAVVDDILDFSKIESGKLTLEDEPLDVRATIGQAVDMIRLKAQEKGLSVDVQVAPDVPVAIRGDVTRLRQVLLNLLSNAIKFTAIGGVTLRVDPAQSPVGGTPQLRWEVTDTGVGIKPERIAGLFQPFAQGDTSTTRVYGGTGLGLMICRHLVTRMGGGITVASEPGHGSTFRFTVNAVPADPAGVPTPEPLVPGQRHHAVRVLVVDDNPINLKVAAAMLERLGYSHTGVPGGAEALLALERAFDDGRPYALALIDSHMPEMDGFATARAIAARWTTRAPVLISMSASTLGEDLDRAREAGLVEFLPKPLELPLLARVLERRGPTAGSSPSAAPHDAVTSPRPAMDAGRWRLLGEIDDALGTVRRDLASDFLQTVTERVDAIVLSAQAGDAPALASAAHRLRGAAENIGLAALAACCEQIEEQARAGQVAPVAADSLRVVAAEAQNALRQAVERLGGTP